MLAGEAEETNCHIALILAETGEWLDKGKFHNAAQGHAWFQQ